MKLGETWTYDVSADRWREMHPSAVPSPRHYFGMVYDSDAERVLAMGGAQAGAPDESSMWVHDAANTWTERKPASRPKALSYVAMTYDSRIHKTMLSGGNADGLDETWVYDFGTNTWTRRFPASTPGRLSRMPLVFIPETGQTVLIGGQLDVRQFTYSERIWLYDGDANVWRVVG